MNMRVYFSILMFFIAGLTACDQKVRFSSIQGTDVIRSRPGCDAATPAVVGSTTVEVDQLTDLTYSDATNVNWYILLPDGEQVFQGSHLAITVNQVGSYPAAVWGNDTCGERRQINFDLVIVPSLKDPMITINNNAQYTTQAKVDLQLSAVGASEMYITFDNTCSSGGTWEPYATAKVATLPQESTDTRVYVKYRSAAKETSCVSDGIIFDKTPPELNFVSVPPASAMDSAANFEMAVSDAISGVKSLECSFDNGGFQACQTSMSYSVGYGLHKFEVRASDFAGNFTPTLSYEWSYINNPPTVKILSGPAVSTQIQDTRFTFVGEDDSGIISRYECEVDKDPIVNCSSPLEFNVDFGAHEFKVVAIDGAGLASQPAVYNWVVNKTPPPPVPPTVKIVSGPASVTYDLTAAFEFSATHSGVGIKSFYCKIDNEPVVACKNPKQYSVQVGAHVFEVYAIDNDGLHSNTASYTWKVEKKRIPYNDSFVVDTSGRKLDVVIVIDNSPSMAEEQAKMAKRFSTFIDTLKDLDWQLGIITTDAKDGNKAWQDGRLLPFEGLKNVYSINAKTPGVNEVFAKTIKRKEWGTSNEEGIHSLYKAIQRSDNRFLFREHSHVASVIVSDEDEKSNGKNLKDVNQPTNLVAKFKEVFGEKNTFSSHSIVLPVGAESTRDCPQVGSFHSGDTYMKLSKLTDGFIGNLCDSDYGAILKGIGDNIRAKTYSVLLRCVPTQAPVVKITPTPAQPIGVDLQGNRLTLKPYPAIGSKVEVEYYCD